MSTFSDKTILQAALRFAEQKMSVFPCMPKGKKPATTNGYKDATLDVIKINEWWSDNPSANIGLPTGSVNGFFVIDIDGVEGEASLKKLEQEFGDLPPTIENLTGGHGRHLLFKYPEDKKIPNSASKLGSAIDVRGDGGYIIAPPSIHQTGRIYQRSVDSASEMAEAPEWLLQRICFSKNNGAESGWEDLLKGATKGGRNQAIASMAGKLFARGFLFEEALEICLSLNQKCKPPLEQSEVKRTVESIFKLNSNKSAKSSDAKVSLVCVADVEMKSIDWLWYERIAQGKLTVIAGNPGLGKSQITASMSAIVSNGLKWPSGEQYEAAGAVIIVSAEDDVADTIKPRLIAAGANLKQCHVLQAVHVTDAKGRSCSRSLDLSKDLKSLEETLKAVGNVRLIIVDPISAYMGDTDSHNNTEVRALLTPLADMAAKYNVAVLLITHLNKSNTQEPIGRVIGSIGLIAAARAGYVVVKDAEKPELRHFVPIKNNIGNDRNGFSFEIEGVSIEDTTLSLKIETSRIAWQEGAIDAHKVFSQSDAAKKSSSTGDVDEFLQDLLSQSPKAASYVLDEASGMGYSEAVMQRAARRIGIKRKKHGMSGAWYWFLPDQNFVDFFKKMMETEESEGVEDVA